MPRQAKASDRLGAISLARCLVDPRRLAIGSDGAGDHWENMINFQARRAAMSAIPQMTEPMLAGISRMNGLPGEGPEILVGVSGRDISATWNGETVTISGEDFGRVMDDLGRRLASRGQVQSKDFANLAILGASMLSSSDDGKRWIMDGKQHIAIVGRATEETLWASASVNPSRPVETGTTFLVAVIPRWGMPPAIVRLTNSGNEVDKASPFWSSVSLIPSRLSLLADACEPQPILWSAINSNKGWGTARVTWFVSSTMVVTASSSESMDDGTAVTTTVIRELKGHGSIRMSRRDDWKTIEEASDSLSSSVEKLVSDHHKTGSDFCADSWDFQMPEPHEVVRRAIEDRALWSPEAVRLLGIGINRTMIQWCTAIR